MDYPSLPVFRDCDRAGAKHARKITTYLQRRIRDASNVANHLGKAAWSWGWRERASNRIHRDTALRNSDGEPIYDFLCLTGLRRKRPDFGIVTAFLLLAANLHLVWRLLTQREWQGFALKYSSTFR
jgi:hypothetical protein